MVDVLQSLWQGGAEVLLLRVQRQGNAQQVLQVLAVLTELLYIHRQFLHELVVLLGDFQLGVVLFHQGLHLVVEILSVGQFLFEATHHPTVQLLE